MGRSARAVAVGLVLLVLTGGVSLASGGSVGPSITASIIHIAPWQPNTDSLQALHGIVRFRGSPVAGAVVRVDKYVLPSPTAAHGQFTSLTDATLLARHVVTVIDATNARVGGAPLQAAGRASLLTARGAIDVAYPITDLRVSP